MIRRAVPDATVPTSIRVGGAPVQHGSTTELGTVLDRWLDRHSEETGCVIATPPRATQQLVILTTRPH